MFDLTKPLDSTSYSLLTLLFPGLLSFALFHAISRRREKIEAVNAVVYSLALTLVVQSIWLTAKSLGSLIPTPDVVGLCSCAVILGLFLVFADDSAITHRFLRTIGVSRNSPWVTIWQTAFRELLGKEGGYAVIHLKDQRRIMGLVCGVSPDQKDGHIVIQYPYWLKENDRVYVPGILIIPANDIAFVEILSSGTGENYHDETIRSEHRDKGGLVGAIEESSTTSTTSPSSTPSATSSTTTKTTTDLDATHSVDMRNTIKQDFLD